MKKIKNSLLLVYWMVVLIAAILYILVEFLGFDFPGNEKTSQNVIFIISTAMILITLAIIPTALRLFKFKYVARQFEADSLKALGKWGVARIAMLGGTLIVNTICYYFFDLEPGFGYLAIITLISMAFIYPTMKRCIAETSSTPNS